MEMRAEWLRERCTSAASVDQTTKQMLRNPHEYDLPAIHAARTDEGSDKKLFVTFTDAHESVFRLGDLAAEVSGGKLVPVQVTAFQDVAQRLWNATTLGAIAEVDFDALHSGDAAVREGATLHAYRALLEMGILLINGVPRREGECSLMAELLSSLRATEWGKQFNVRPVPDGNKKDLAYGSSAIGMHTDNAYRDPTPDFQLMHAIDHCECKAVDNGKNCTECTVFNTFTDGKFVAEKLSKEQPWAFQQLSSVPVRFENNGGDDTSFLSFQVPHFQLHPDHVYLRQQQQQEEEVVEEEKGEEDEDTSAGSAFRGGDGGACGARCVRSIRFSSKSGGYAPPGAPRAFYDAKRLFSREVHREANSVPLQLKPGQLVVFDNERILHARSSIAESDGSRFLQGCYLNRDGVKLGYERLRRKDAAREEAAREEAARSGMVAPVPPPG